MAALMAKATKDKPVLVGTWAESAWAIKFYEANGFQLIADTPTKDALLRKYWFAEGLGELNNPTSEHRQRQMAASVVLADRFWFFRQMVSDTLVESCF